MRRDRSRMCNETSALSQAYRALSRRIDGTPLDNAAATARSQPFELLATLSSGYDSPTVAVLARGVGCRRASSASTAPAVATTTAAPRSHEHLGLRYHAVETSAWRAQPLAAVPFLAPSRRAVPRCRTREPSPCSPARSSSRGTTATRSGHREPDGRSGPTRPERHAGDGPHANTGSGSASSTARCPFSESARSRTFTRSAPSYELGPWNANHRLQPAHLPPDRRGTRRPQRDVRRAQEGDRATAPPDGRLPHARHAVGLLPVAPLPAPHVDEDADRTARASLADLRLHRSGSRRRARGAPARGRAAVEAAGCTGRRAAARLSARSRPGEAHHQFIYHWAVDAPRSAIDPRRTDVGRSQIR